MRTSIFLLSALLLASTSWGQRVSTPVRLGDGSNWLSVTGGKLDVNASTSGSASTNVSATVAAGSISDSGAYASNLVVKASPGTLVAVWGFTSRATGQYIQFYNATTLPADGVAPYAAPIAIGPTNSFYFDVPNGGIPFSSGIVIGNSTTATNKTGGSADVWFSAIYR